MEPSEEKPKVRVVKARNQAKSGMMQVQDRDGKTFYKVPCDRCGMTVQLPFQPYKDREVTCRECRFVQQKAKPSTRVKRKGDKVAFYLTECDLCGDKQKTPFLPKKDRRFLCDGCYHAEKEEARAKAPPAVATPAPLTEEAATLSPQEAAPPTTEQTTPPKAEEVLAVPSEQAAPSSESVAPEPVPAELYDVTCRRCKKVEQFRFKPERGEYFMCKDCYIKDQEREEARKDKPDTRILFQIECVACGKDETVNFIPKNMAEPMCSACFEKHKQQRR